MKIYHDENGEFVFVRFKDILMEDSGWIKWKVSGLIIGIAEAKHHGWIKVRVRGVIH